MWNLNYTSVKEVSAVLSGEGLAMTKKFGQNFLIDRNARDAVAAAIGASDGMHTWEIGPGMGSITAMVLSSGAYVKAFEIDNGFCRLLSGRAFADEERFSLVSGDALKTIPLEKECPDIIYGNLPYNVGSVIIARLIESSVLPSRMVYTLQKEVVERMCAAPGSDDWSSFSVLCQIDYVPRLAFVIKRGCFYPEPNVESAVVVMEKRDEPAVPEGIRDVFISMTRALFAQRRKTVRNNLKALCLKDADHVLSAAGLTGSERAETLPLPVLVNLASAVSSDRSS
ncbi:MAG: 16S rRNA (adenine(1518)-N(6)/adenine(1519)-N(6))-dimethyltransferase RsmA [Bullifex sp.]